MSASTGDWWRDTVQAAADEIQATGLTARVVECALRAALPLFVAEATRRIEAERIGRASDDEERSYNIGLADALVILAGLAGEVGQHD